MSLEARMRIRLLRLLNDPEKLFEDLKSEENTFPAQYGLNVSTTMLVSTWLSKFIMVSFIMIF